jgi:hypothetical protein
MITRHLTALLVLMILAIVLLYALLVISIRQEKILDELLKRSGNIQDTLALLNPETRSQAGSNRNGERN